MEASGIDVIVVGAGPGGLLLASELALAGISCMVLERRPGRSAQSRALGLQPRTLELLELRDQAHTFTSMGNPLDHYRLTVGATRLDLHGLDSAFQQLSILPQSQTEELLEQRAVELGAVIRRNVEVVGVRQERHRVRVDVRAPDGSETRAEYASWVVGCDGSHSSVRESLGIGFPGKTYPYNVVVGDVRLALPPADGMLIEVGGHGLVVAIDFGNGWWRMGVVDWNTPRDPAQPATVAELSRGLTGIFGYDLGLSDPLWMTRFKFQNRHATTYRQGRVLLLGDAAHVHAPLGAQGLNMSMQDAMNLGWKLAAVAKGNALASLLDSYEAERRPVAARVLRATDAAIRVLMSKRSPVRLARRAIIPNIARTPVGHRMLTGYISGLSWSYPSRNGHRRDGITGRRLPDASLRNGDGRSRRLFEFFRDGKFVLIDQADGRLASAAAPWDHRVAVLTARIEGHPDLAAHAAILCRPDGYGAWAGGPDDIGALTSELRRWCGEPATARFTQGQD